MNDADTPETNTRPLPVVLAFPRVYERLLTSRRSSDFRNALDKCCELSRNRPAAQDRHGGFFGMGGIGEDNRLALFTVWAIQDDKPDIFILAGRGDGFGPGHTCPSKDELRVGIYGDLVPVPFL